jgi:DNA-binding response OmpR family regulator
MHILIIEDNTTIAQNMQTYLSLDGHTADVAHDGPIGIEKATQHSYDVIVLDIMLPTMSGIDVSHAIRAKHKTPIIMTTAKWTLEDKGEGFGAWADDYIVKPFALEELSMRINALHKRYAAPDVYRIGGGIEIFADRMSITHNGSVIKCTPKEYAICTHLAKNVWHIVSRRSLIEEIWWEDTGEFDGTLDVYIANIRKKLWKSFIETIKGSGYKIPLL